MQATPYSAPTPYQPAPVLGQEPIKPSAWWFGVAALVAVVGIVVGITIAVRTAIAWADRIEGLQRIDVPGRGTVVIDEPGGYTVYYEYGFGETPLFVDDGDVAVVVTAPDGSDVPLGRYTSSVNYTHGEHQGEALFSFRAEQAGEYEVTARGRSNGVGVGSDLEGQVAVGRSLASGVVGGVLGALAVGLGGLIAGGIIAIVVGVGRTRERRRRRIAFTRAQSGWASTTPGGPPGPPGYAAPPPPPSHYGSWPQPSRPPQPPSPPPP